VRELAGIERTSFGFEEQWVIFDLRLGTPRPPLPTRAVQVCDPARPHTELPMPSDRYRFEFMLMPGERADELQRPDVAFDRLLAGLVPRDSVEIERTATYTFAGLVADRWRSGRVLVAGDAAHLMPPFLGQGMCSGIRDAANLAWKLDHVHRRGASISLLDTYMDERRPHVSEVIRAAVELGRIICTTDPVAAAARDREMLAGQSTEPPYRFALPTLRPGPLVISGGGVYCPQPAADAAGRRLDDVVGPRFLVLVPEGEEDSPAARWWRDTVGALVAPPTRLPDPDGRLADWLARRGARSAIVRPDRYLLWAGRDLASATDAVRPWLAGTEGVPPAAALERSR
jgi:3-(3-hydroxy-phenyl)propionate hydroxylase